MSLNKAVINGELLFKPEIRHTNSNEAVTNLTIRTGENVKIKLVCWRELAEKAATLEAGSLLMAVGSLMTSSYKTQAGVNKKDLEVNVTALYSMGGEMKSLIPIFSKNNDETPKPNNAKKSPINNSKSAVSKNNEDEEDLSDVIEEIPF